MNPARLTPQPKILDCGGKRSATPLLDATGCLRKAVSPLRSATAVQIFVVRARSCRIVLQIGKEFQPCK